MPSTLRGHTIHEKDGEWVYSNTDLPTVGNHLPCGYCGKTDTPEGYDGCLGHLPGVMNACCGHGKIRDAYVQFSSLRRIHGNAADEYFKTNSKRYKRRNKCQTMETEMMETLAN